MELQRDSVSVEIIEFINGNLSGVITIVRSRRSKMDITVEILKITVEGANKTQIVYGANLNFVLAGKYLDYLQNNGFVKSVDSPTHYQITEKGRKFLEKIEDIMQTMS